MVSDECCKSISECCICSDGCTRMLQRYVPNVSSVFLGILLQVCLFGCCICFTHMLQVFYLNVVYILQLFQMFFQVFLQVFQVYVLSVSSVFRRMLQVLHPDVLKVDWVLHLYLRFFAASPSHRCLLLLLALAGHPPSPSYGCWRSHLL